MQAVHDRFWTVNLVLLAAFMVIAVGLLIGGIQSLRRRPPARQILRIACAAAFVGEIVRAIVAVCLQIQTMSTTMHHIQEMSSSAEMDFVVTIMRAGMVVGILLSLGWVLAKLAYYGISVWYLRQPHARAYLDGPSTASLCEQG
jgi:hypothetical protein